jgi:hypothetical protein
MREKGNGDEEKKKNVNLAVYMWHICSDPVATHFFA